MNNISEGPLLIFLIAFLLISGRACAFDFEVLDFKVSASVLESYDDNITQTNENEQKDFITNLSFGLGVQSERKLGSFDLTAKIVQQIFAKYSDYNRLSENLILNFQQEFSKYDRMSLRDVFSHTYETITFEQAFGRTPGRYSQYRNRFNIDYTRDIAKQISLSAKYDNEINVFSREDVSDSLRNRFGVQLDYFPTSADILMFSYDFSRRDFDPGGYVATNSIAAGLRHYLTSQLYFDGKVGMDVIDSYTNKNYTKAFIQTSLTSDVDENSRASISFAKRYDTTAYSEDLFDYWQISGMFTRQLFKRLGFFLFAFYGQGEYIIVDVTDNLCGADIGFTYDLTRNLKGRLNYNYSNVDSTLDTRDYSRNRAFLGLAAEF